MSFLADDKVMRLTEADVHNVSDDGWWIRKGSEFVKAGKTPVWDQKRAIK